MKIRRQYLTVTETTDKAFIDVETENLTIPTWKIDYVIEKLNEIMDLVVDMGQEDEPFFKKLIPGLEKVTINNENESIGVVWVFNDDRVIGALYYGCARDRIVDIVSHNCSSIQFEMTYQFHRDMPSVTYLFLSYIHRVVKLSLIQKLLHLMKHSVNL